MVGMILKGHFHPLVICIMIVFRHKCKLLFWTVQVFVEKKIAATT
jgi:hypothetical protein